MSTSRYEDEVMKYIRLLSSVVCPLGVCMHLPAAEFCVINSTELQNALNTAASNGKANLIRVVAGNYLAPVGGFSYNASIGANNNNLWGNTGADL